MQRTALYRRIASLCLALVITIMAASSWAQAVPRRSVPDEFAKFMLERLDKNHDGKIDRDEMDKRLLRVFDRMDRDGDGLVDADELKQFAEQRQKRQAARRGNAQGSPRVAKPAATHANVAYGPHERNVLDLWQAESTEPTPLAVYIHGGGFISGSKEKLNALILRRLLGAGISVAALNYRYATQAPLPAAHHDCRRALQFLRSKAQEWNLDKTRVGAFGGSAGAQLSMYLAFHDEMVASDSPDPIARESTRLRCVATTGGQTTMDMSWWKEHVPGYEKPHRELSVMFGADDSPERRKQVADISALSLISKDDPPIFMIYGMKPGDPVPDDARRAWGWKVHHVVFGIALKERMDALGVEADLKYPGVKNKYRTIPDFLIAKLGKSAK